MLRLRVAGFSFVFKGYAPSIIDILRRRYAAFAAAGGGRFKLEVSRRAGRSAPFTPVVSQAGCGLKLARGDFDAGLDLGTGTGELRAAANEQCLDAFLRSLLSCLLLREEGLMLHSACLVKRGKAFLFLGKSGAGKSTLSRLAAGAGYEVVSDEINMLRPSARGFRVYGSPFWGEMRADGRPGSRPLGGICLLKKAARNRVRPCGGPEVLKLLLRCLLNFEAGPDTAGRALKSVARLMAGVRFSVLEFSKADAAFLELI